MQEAFIRLARGSTGSRDAAKAPAYLRSIVLNLARDHNRRGLMSLRHHLPEDDQAAVEDEITLRDDQQRVIDALRSSRTDSGTASCSATTTTSESTTSRRRSGSRGTR